MWRRWRQSLHVTASTGPTRLTRARLLLLLLLLLLLRSRRLRRKGPNPAAGCACSLTSTPRAARYRQLMGVLLANKRRFGLRMTPPKSRLASGIGTRARYQSAEALERDLEALCGWGAVDAHPGQLPRRIDRRVQAQALHLRHHGGRRDRRGRRPPIDRLSERIGALERSQLPELLDALIALAAETERRDPRPAKLVALFNDVAAKLGRCAPTPATSCASWGQ